jgi:hypothetical protein
LNPLEPATLLWLALRKMRRLRSNFYQEVIMTVRQTAIAFLNEEQNRKFHWSLGKNTSNQDELMISQSADGRLIPANPVEAHGRVHQFLLQQKSEFTAQQVQHEMFKYLQEREG